MTDPSGIRKGNAPAQKSRTRVYGVDYAHLVMEGGDEMFLTPRGWQLRQALLPEVWYREKRFRKIGERLDGASGAVYRVRVPSDGPREAVDLVVKFSRVAQNVPLYIRATFPPDALPEMTAPIEFNDPFEEFGHLTRLREGPRTGPRIRTKRPLAIFCPAGVQDPRRIARNRSEFARHRSRLKKAGERPSETPDLYLDRDYITLFEWVEGENAQDLYMEGILDREDLRTLTRQVAGDLRQHGYVVLDNKPRHFILRRSADGKDVLRRHGRFVYALVDFELLQPDPPESASP